MAPSLKRHHESPSQPASKKQRVEQNETGTGKLSAARPPQISPGKQAVQSIQERDAAESVHFLQSASRPREPLHGLQSPAKSRDGGRSGHEGPGQAHGPREPLDGPESPARSRDGVRSGHEGPGPARESPEALHPLQPLSRTRDGMRSQGPGEAHGWHEAAKLAQHGGTAQRHAQLEYETTLLPPSQPLGFSSYLHGHHLHRYALTSRWPPCFKSHSFEACRASCVCVMPEQATLLGSGDSPVVFITSPFAVASQPVF